ncbi:MAG: uracil-DNA glycosylase [Roseomonas sp.]|jgi:probable DNA metabolism protein|nr:uracil-DNA glycosylase [Roseomonas sp.]
MYSVTLAGPADFDGWRRAARTLLAAGLDPGDIAWLQPGEEAGLFPTDPIPPGDRPMPAVPRDFMAMAEAASRHADPGRFALLHRLLWRAGREPGLLRTPTDRDMLRAEAMARAVRRDAHKMHAFLRFREIGTEAGPRSVAWFEPEHHILEAESGFFVRRFAGLRWSILTPRLSAHWDGQDLCFSPGARRQDAPAGDDAEDLWRTYFANTFNPARLKPAAMRAEMPKKYWHALPEAEIIPALIHAAEDRVRAMIERGASAPIARRQRRL